MEEKYIHGSQRITLSLCSDIQTFLLVPSEVDIFDFDIS